MKLTKYKKIFILLSLLVIITIGCSKEKNLGQNPSNMSTNQFQPTRDKPEQNEELEHTLGFVRYTKENVKMMHDTELDAPKIDRNEKADTITKILLQNESFDEVATLVTDTEVLIAYDSLENVDVSELTTIAKKTAESIMPRYYDVYVSHQPQHMDLIHSLHNSYVDSESEHTIKKIIKEMKLTPGEPEDEV